MRTTLYRVAGASTAAALALFTACASDKVTSPEGSTRLAVTTRIDNKPSFILQNLDGSDTRRFHFTGVVDNVPGNTNTITLSDDALLDVSAPRASRPGSQVAVVASVAFDQSEVVIFDLATGKGRVASPNTQLIGAVDWSKDIAYTMSTVLTSGFDLFTTNLSTMQVRRLTTGANLAQSAIRWNLEETAIYYSQHVADAKDAAGNWISQIARLTLASNVVDTIRTNILGQVQAITRDGKTALVVRMRSRGVDTFRADLLRVNLADGTETPLITNEMIVRAQLETLESRAIVALAIGPAGVTLAYDLVDLSSGARARIPGVGGSDVDIDVIPRLLLL